MADIQIVPLDFDSIRADLKRFLQSQNILKDYNFEGSALAQLIDILAYDAYYHGWYTNFAVNETFLHTAQVRNSVVAAARQLGYTPQSAMGSVAIVDVTVGNVNLNEGTITLPRFTPFTTTIAGNTFSFYTISDYTTTVNSQSTLTLSAVELYEGTLLTETMTVNTVPSTGVKVTLLNQNVDTRTIRVSVYPHIGSNTRYEYVRATSSVNVNASSNVYFLFESNDGSFELQFGDGYLGRALSANQQIVVSYLNTHAEASIGANTFVYAGNALGIVVPTSNVSVSLNNVNIPAYGGTPRETIERIKKNAPSIYQTQGRIVTPYDAQAILLSEVGGIDSMTVWGGEDNDPPTFGKMFIALKPVNSEKLGTTQKEQIIRTILRPKSSPIVGFEIVDPDYIYLVIDSVVRYTPALTASSAEEIRQQILTAILKYGESELGQFGSFFRSSQLSRTIDGAETSVVSNMTSVMLEKKMTISTTKRSYELYYSNPIFAPVYNGTAGTSTNPLSVSSKVGSQLFSHIDEAGLTQRNCWIQNDGSIIHVCTLDTDGTTKIVKSSVGSVDFESGTIILTNFTPKNITTNNQNELRVRVIPDQLDLAPNQRQIILLHRENVSISMVEDTINRRGTTVGRPVRRSTFGA